MCVRERRFVFVLDWWGEAPERPDNPSEAIDDRRLTVILCLRSRRAVAQR